VWTLADRLRTDPPDYTVNHPWCLQSDAYSGLALPKGLDKVAASTSAPLLAAFHHWRSSRSVYVTNPFPVRRPHQSTAPLGGIDIVQLPDWCVYNVVAQITYRWLAHPIWDDHYKEPLLSVVIDHSQIGFFQLSFGLACERPKISPLR
jgi:hypothetical protein